MGPKKKKSSPSPPPPLPEPACCEVLSCSRVIVYPCYVVSPFEVMAVSACAAVLMFCPLSLHNN